MFLARDQKPIIFYTPGARGDFLGRVLTDGLASNWKSPLINTTNKYYKLHNVYHQIFGEEPVMLADIANSYSIRIRLNLIDDVLTIAYNVITKIGDDKKLTHTDICKRIINQERDHRKLDSLFTQIVNFNQIDNPAFLLVMVHQTTGHLLTKAEMDRIRYNIGLQTKVNLSNHQNYLNIDITEVIKYYELGNGFN